jgi:hypothetical protein
MDVSTPPSLDLACPQAKAELSKLEQKFMEWSVDNKEYGQEASVITKQHTHFKQQLLFI